MKFIITVDTEADDQWAQRGTATLDNLGALPRFQAFMRERGVPPTYLASYETIGHPALAELAAAHRRGEAEVGGHLHPWTTPPLSGDDGTQRFPLELPDEELDGKLGSLTKALTDLLGETPRSFRAGRWGADLRVLRAVARHGYRVDSSVTPGIRWASIVRDADKHHGFPDFSEQSAASYLVPETELLEVPMSVLRTGFIPAAGKFHQSPGILGRVARALSRPRWCRIFPHTTARDLEAVYQAARRQGLPALVFMIHSSELVVGKSPYVTSAESLERVYRTLDFFLQFLKREGVQFSRLCDMEKP